MIVSHAISPFHFGGIAIALYLCNVRDGLPYRPYVPVMDPRPRPEHIAIKVFKRAGIKPERAG